MNMLPLFALLCAASLAVAAPSIGVGYDIVHGSSFGVDNPIVALKPSLGANLTSRSAKGTSCALHGLIYYVLTPSPLPLCVNSRSFALLDPFPHHPSVGRRLLGCPLPQGPH